MLLPIIILLFTNYVSANIRYDNFLVQRITPQTVDQLNVLRDLQEKGDGYSFWTDVTTLHKPVDILVPPGLGKNFDNITNSYNLESKVLIHNIQALIDNERSISFKAASDFGWDGYHTLDQINAWLLSLKQKYPGIVEKVIGGKSYQGREIIGVKVSFKSGNKGVLIEGGIHAREWIAPATVTYILNELLASKDATVRKVAESRDWYVFPVLNPDGYVYTHTKDRLWRKTRQPYGICVGADANRNWAYYWNRGGASLNPCSESYAGPYPFSETETYSFATYLGSIAKNLDSYLAFHAYSQLLLLPFGHNGQEVPANNEELLRIGKNAAAKLAERYGTTYTVGNIPQAIYVASGGSMDYAVGLYRNIRLPFTYELRDTGAYGFLLPPELIIPTAEETFDSVISIFEQADAT